MVEVQKANSFGLRFIAGTETEKLLNAIECELETTEYCLSRWQYNKGGHQVSIHYGIHTGDRPEQFRRRDNTLFHDWVELTQLEGKTKRSEAYRKLSQLLESAKLLNQIQNMGA